MRQQQLSSSALSIFPNGLLRRHCRLLLITRWRISDRVFDAPSTVWLELTTEVLRRFRWFPPKIQWWIADFALNSLQLRKRQSIGRLGGIHNRAQQCIYIQNKTKKADYHLGLNPGTSGLRSVTNCIMHCTILRLYSGKKNCLFFWFIINFFSLCFDLESALQPLLLLQQQQLVKECCLFSIKNCTIVWNYILIYVSTFFNSGSRNKRSVHRWFLDRS